MLSPAERRPVIRGIPNAEIRPCVDHDTDGVQGARGHCVMKRRRVRVEVGADTVHIDTEAEDLAKRVSFAFQRRQRKRKLSLASGRSRSKASHVVPPAQTERRGERQRSPSTNEVLGGVEVAVDERVLRISLERRALVDEEIDERDLHMTVTRDPGPGHEVQRVIELLLPAVDALTVDRVHDRACDIRDVLRQRAVPDWIFSDEPKQIRILEEPVQSTLDDVAQPGAGRFEANAYELGVIGQDTFDGRDFATIDGGHCTAEKRVTFVHGPTQVVAACTARCNAARASKRVESSVGNGELPSFMINGISVQPRTTASQPSPFIRSMTP